jgi:hypothetical protein
MVPAEGAQDIVVRKMTNGAGADYFKHYCVALVPGALPSPATTETRLKSVQQRPDPSPTVLSRLQRLSSHIVPASECVSVGEDLVHRRTNSKPALLIVVGPIEVVSADRVRITTFSSSGFLTETYSLVELVRDGGEWRIESDKILLQA